MRRDTTGCLDIDGNTKTAAHSVSMNRFTKSYLRQS